MERVEGYGPWRRGRLPKFGIVHYVLDSEERNKDFFPMPAKISKINESGITHRIVRWCLKEPQHQAVLFHPGNHFVAYENDENSMRMSFWTTRKHASIFGGEVHKIGRRSWLW